MGLYFALGIMAASLSAALVYIGTVASQDQHVEDGTFLDRIVVTKTVTSIQDPAVGHESHQVAMFLPPLGEDVIYSGTLTWAASGPVELFSYHHYDGPAINSPPLYTEPSDGITYVSPLFFTSSDSADHGSMNLAANAMGFHTQNGMAFTVTATFDGLAKKVAIENFQGNPMSDHLPSGSNQTIQSNSEPVMIIPQTTSGQQHMTYTVIAEDQLQDLLDTELAGWVVVDSGSKLHKTFQFKNFVEAFQFMYNVGVEAERMNHHPDWTNNYDTVSVYLYTWSIGDKITDYDVRLAGVMDREAAALAATDITETDYGAGKIFDSPHIRVDYLFLTTRTDGTIIEQELIEQTRTELAERFGGVTVIPSFSGTTIHNGIREDGTDNAGFFVIAPNTLENIERFLEYSEIMKERFGLNSIFTTLSPSMIA